jgi:hydroxymethylglutaryl-CoA lyase
MLTLPSRIEIVEVAPRDGLQSFPRPVDTATKIRLVDMLSSAGFGRIEVTAFAHPRAVPNLADAEAVMGGIARRPGTVYRALVPNARGAARAVQAGADEILGLATISRTYLRRNQNMTPDQAITEAMRAAEIAFASGRRFVMALGMAFWCPYEGSVPEDDVLRFLERLQPAGIRSFYLAGSVGLEDPRHVGRLFVRLRALWPDSTFGYHVHDRAGFAPANILAAADAGVDWVESAICGLGGGIAMPGTMGSVGNYPTDDLVNLLESTGVLTGLDADAVYEATRAAAALLGVEPAGRAARRATRTALLTASSEGAAEGLAA